MIIKNKKILGDNDGSLKIFDEHGYEVTNHDDVKELLKTSRQKGKEKWSQKKYRLSRWGQEVVDILKEHGEIKNIDILQELRSRGLKGKQTKVRDFFGSEQGKQFYKNELISNGGYWSLKD